MATSRGIELAQQIRQKVAASKQPCGEVDENLAGQAPAGRWSPKMILSHLCGPEGAGHLPLLRAFIERDTSLLDLNAGNPFFTENRAAMSFGDLVAECDSNYQQVAGFVEGLAEEQLARTAHIPELKDSPLGEHPTLAGMIGGLASSTSSFTSTTCARSWRLFQVTTRGSPPKAGFPAWLAGPCHCRFLKSVYCCLSFPPGDLSFGRCLI